VINTAGHTPGHFSYELKTNAETVVFIGDIVHSHTVQFDRPETQLNMILTKTSRPNPLKTVCQFCQKWSNHCSTTFTISGIGHIYSADGKSYQWIPVHFKD
jgi:hypothetical protein